MKKEEADRIYNKLKKDYTDEEIAESFVFSVDMTDEDTEELMKAINKRRMAMSEIDKEKIRIFAEKLKKSEEEKLRKKDP